MKTHENLHKNVNENMYFGIFVWIFVKFSLKCRTTKLGNSMIFRILGSFCSFLNWGDIHPQIRPRKIPDFFCNFLFSDREAVTELDAKLKEERKQSGEMVTTIITPNFLTSLQICQNILSGIPLKC